MEFLLRILMRLLALLPLRVHYALGDAVSWLAEYVFRYRVHDVTVNLARSFPEKKYKELKQIRHDFYRHFGEVLAETVWFGGRRGVKGLYRAHIAEIANPEEINGLYDKAPSVMVLMSHSGNWELIGGIQSYDYSGKPGNIDEKNYFVVYLQQSSRVWDNIMRHNRTANLKDPKNYRGYLESRQVLRFALGHREEKIFYNFITDQYPYFSQASSPVVEFMHQETILMKGAADLARKCGMAVCYLSMPRVKRGLYRLNYVTICENASELSSEDIMNEYYRLLQQDIEAQPWNYLWTHRRWK